MTKKAEGTPKSILDLLPEEERDSLFQKIAREAVSTVVDEVTVASGTVGDFIDAITVHEHTDVLRSALLQDVLVGAPAAPVKKKAKKTKAASGEPKAPRKPRQKLEDKVVTDVLGYIQNNPGKGAAEITAGIGHDKADVSKALGKLRKGGMVKTTGEKRSMVYSAK